VNSSAYGSLAPEELVSIFVRKIKTLVASALWLAVGGCRGFWGWFEDGREKPTGVGDKEESPML